MNSIFFSIIVPLYNKQEYILRTVDSVLQQSHTNFELIVVDDGSKDRSYARLCERTDARIRRIRQKNQGEGAARNRGISEARGSYVAFLDADDEWNVDYLSRIASLIDKYPNQCLYATGYLIQERMRNTVVGSKSTGPHLVQNYFSIAYQGQLPLSASSVAIDRQSLLSCGGFQVNEPLGADQDLWCRLLFNESFAYDPYPLAIYHKEAEGRICTSQIPHDILPFADRLHTNLDGYTGDSNYTRNVERYIAAHLLYIARLNIEAHRYGIASTLLSDPRTKVLSTKRLIQTTRLYLSQHATKMRSLFLSLIPINHSSTLEQ